MATGNKHVWAYDTFDGEFPLHTVGEGEDPDNYRLYGQFSSSIVRSSLEEIGVTCVIGVFPATFFTASPREVSFVHVDMDTYMATQAALELFHPRMIYSGVFLVHDYDNWGMPGVKRAVDEFVASPMGKEYGCDMSDGHFRLRRRWQT